MDFKADLTNCDREPIHIPGKIQPHGMLLALDKKSLVVTHVSSNAADYFNVDPSAILDKPFLDFTKNAGINTENNNLSGFINNRSINPETENSLIITTNDGRNFYMVVNASNQSVIIELEPVRESLKETKEHIMESLLTKILGARSLDETLQWSALQVKEIIGYDRVMIYRFAEDGHGEVVAEAVNEGFESFMGLHYPASDIPKQARELYKRNLVRIIADVDASDAMIEANNEATKNIPLNLTDSVLRAVSPIHIQYLKNMGVKASFSVSLISDGELWGLIACHNYAPNIIDYKKRNSCKVIGQLLSTSLVYRENEEDKEQKNQFRDHMLDMVKLVRSAWDIPAALMDDNNNLLSMTEASGAALLYEEKVYTIGETPSEEEILSIAKWLHHHTKNQVYQTNNLGKEFVDADAFKSNASGLMSCALSRELNEYIFWFKKEMPQTVKWAGNPQKPVEVDEQGLLSLSPRNSFDVWTEEVEGVSEPWNSNEIGVAMKFREELVHIINERANQIRKLNEKLKQAYDELDTFSFTISHDLKTPLSSIKNYTELLLEDDDYNSATARPMLEKIVKGADKMNLLIKEVLSYSRIGRQNVNPEFINAAELLEEIKGELEIAYKHATPRINIHSTADFYADKIMMYQVFSNLIGNAVKYSSQAADPVVDIKAVSSGNEITYSIADNGIGIDMKNGDQIFDLFKRMNNAGKFEGTGVGLAIVKRILEKHNARIWYESEPGNGTVFYLRIKTEQDVK
ncbi:MAG: GAF domain-containing protein [Sphingobacteriales bacterium]|nr:MAG: GAF domain-containing protein [Sphingobacteriales bacterium]